jgi:putative two-component system response regulator
VDYIVKPISPPIVLARVKTHLTLKAAADFLRDKNEFLEREVEQRTAEITAIQNATIRVVTSLAETRDQETGHHIRRTQSYVQLLAERLSQDPRFHEALTAAAIATLYKSAPLHDIGKVGIPDRILLKPGKLTAAEFEVMKTHTTIGCAAIERAEAQLGIEVDFLKTAKQIALSHHEKWDGSGYPQGLRGTEIPLPARVMAIADVYDALISQRVYKEAIPHPEAMRIILTGRGSHFDPDVADAFAAIEEEIYAIAERFKDMKMDRPSLVPGTESAV